MELRRIASLKTADDLRDALGRLGVDLAVDATVEPGPESPLGRPYAWRGGTVGNRFAILPMEGGDGTEDGRPSELTVRRWEHFGRSGAKLIWGGEAGALPPHGGGHPHPPRIHDAQPPRA